MNNGFVRRRPSSAETGKLGVDAIALQNIGGRDRFAAPLVGHCPLYDCPVNPTIEAVLRCVDDVLEATVDDQMGRIDMTVEISDVKHLQKVIKSLRSIAGVVDVERAAR